MSLDTSYSALRFVFKIARNKMDCIRWNNAWLTVNLLKIIVSRRNSANFPTLPAGMHSNYSTAECFVCKKETRDLTMDCPPWAMPPCGLGKPWQAAKPWMSWQWHIFFWNVFLTFSFSSTTATAATTAAAAAAALLPLQQQISLPFKFTHLSNLLSFPVLHAISDL